MESTCFAEETVKGAFASRTRAVAKDEEEDCELDYFKKASEEDSDY